MFRRQDNNKNQKNGNPNNEIHDEIKEENALLNIGNEAVNRIAGLPNRDSNEANNAILGNVSPDNNEDRIDHYLENDLNVYFSKKNKRKDKNKEAVPNIINNIIEKGMRENEKTDPTGNENILNIIDTTNEKDKQPIIDNKHVSNQKGKKSSKKSKKAAAPAEPEDLTQIDQSLEPVQGWDFVSEGHQAKKLKPRKKQGFGSKLASWAAYYSGKTIGKIGGLIAWLGSSIKGLFSRGPGTLGGTFKRMRGSGRFKRRGDRSLIPGWDGAKFEDPEEAQNPDEISLDFRRVPEVWSWPTAEKPTEGNAEDRNAKPRDPVISVYIAQSSNKYTASKNLSTGHTGIGIEYSRYSALSGRWQRYNLRFGYYMGGGMPSEAQAAVTSYNNATIPGQLLNEQNRLYDVSRSYPVKAKQVSDVLRAAESYADRGGYNAYTRNCTTFAKEMIVDVAKIKGAESVFARDEVYLQQKADAKMFIAGAGSAITKAAMENAFEKIGNKNDLNYQNYGNKMLSREEHERYRNSLSLWSGRQTKADSPNAVAENLKRAEGGKAGTIGKYDVALENSKKVSLASFSNMRETIPFLLQQLMTGTNGLQAITPAEKLSGNGKSQELENLLRDLDGSALSQKLTMLFMGQDDAAIKGKVKQSNIVEARTLFSDLIKKLNILLFRFYKNDARIQKKVLDIISCLNHGIIFLDQAYVSTENNDLVKEDSDLGNLPKNYQSKKQKFTLNGAQIYLTASEYEAWLQVYKSPEKVMV